MIDALDKAFAEADSMVVNCRKSAGTVTGLVASSAGYSNRPLSLVLAREQLAHLRGWIWACVRLVSQRIAGLDVCVGHPQPGQRRKSLGRRIEPLDSHPLLDTLANPNPWNTYHQLMFNAVASLEVTGRAVLWVNKETNWIFFIPTPWIIEIDKLQLWWKVRPTHSADDAITIPGEEIVNLHYPSPTGDEPNEVISPLSRIADAVLTDESIATAQERAFRNGIFPKVVLTAGRLPSNVQGVPGERPTFTAQQRADLIAAITSAYKGVVNADEPIILDSLIEKIEKFSQSIMEMDFIGSSKVTKSRILESYGVSEVLFGCVTNANRATSYTADSIFCDFKINPLVQLISGILTQRLGPMFSGPREKLLVWIENAKPNDAETLIKEWELAMRFGAATRNEFRINVLNLPAIDGGDELMEPIGFLPAQQSDDSDSKPEKRLNGNCNRLTITAN